MPFPSRSLLEQRLSEETSSTDQADLQLLQGHRFTPETQGHPAAC